MPEYLDFDALKAFFSDSQIASLKGQFPVYLKEYVKKEQTSITFLPEKTSYPTETTVCLMFSLSDQDTLPVTYHTPTGVFLSGEDGVRFLHTTVYEKQTDDSLPSLTSQDIEHLQEGGYPDTSDSPEAPDRIRQCLCAFRRCERYEKGGAAMTQPEETPVSLYPFQLH